MPTTTVVDWSKKPEPWRTIGPELRCECEAIAAADLSGAECIKRRRKLFGLTQRQVGKLTGLDPSVVGRAERGNLGKVTVQRIAAALDRLEAEQKTRAA